jgi:phage tail sheath gpL-like
MEAGTVTERRVAMSDGIAERVVRRAISHLANTYPHAPARATAAKELLVHALEGSNQQADEADGYAAAAAMAALAHGIEAETGRGLDWLAVAALQEWDFHHPESPI